MIEFHLKEVLEKSDLSMSELSKITGISRTSLSQLSTGKTQGIQFNTLDKIVYATKCSISDLIVYKPNTNIKVDIISIDKNNKKINCEITNTDIIKSYSFKIKFKVDYEEYSQGVIFNMLDNMSEDDYSRINVAYSRIYVDRDIIKPEDLIKQSNELKEFQIKLNKFDFDDPKTFSNFPAEALKTNGTFYLPKKIFDLFSKQFLISLYFSKNNLHFYKSNQSIFIFNWNQTVKGKELSITTSLSYLDVLPVGMINFLSQNIL